MSQGWQGSWPRAGRQQAAVSRKHCLNARTGDPHCTCDARGSPPHVAVRFRQAVRGQHALLQLLQQVGGVEGGAACRMGWGREWLKQGFGRMRGRAVHPNMAMPKAVGRAWLGSQHSCVQTGLTPSPAHRQGWAPAALPSKWWARARLQTPVRPPCGSHPAERPPALKEGRHCWAGCCRCPHPAGLPGCHPSWAVQPGQAGCCLRVRCCSAPHCRCLGCLGCRQHWPGRWWHGRRRAPPPSTPAAAQAMPLDAAARHPVAPGSRPGCAAAACRACAGCRASGRGPWRGGPERALQRGPQDDRWSIGCLLPSGAARTPSTDSDGRPLASRRPSALLVSMHNLWLHGALLLLRFAGDCQVGSQCSGRTKQQGHCACTSTLRLQAQARGR